MTALNIRPASLPSNLVSYWYVGSSDFNEDDTWACTPDVDELKPEAGDFFQDRVYVNALCATDADLVPDGNTVTCVTTPSPQSFSLEAASPIYCAATKCKDVPTGACQNPVDLYKKPASGVDAEYSTSCLIKDGVCAEVQKPTGVLRLPSDAVPQGDNVNYWYIGSVFHDSSITYNCTDDDDNINGYFNLLCTHSKLEVDDGLTVTCTDREARDTLHGDLTCGYTSCDTLDVDYCEMGVDLYVVDAFDKTKANFVSSCVQDNADSPTKCVTGTPAPPSAQTTSTESGATAVGVLSVLVSTLAGLLL